MSDDDWVVELRAECDHYRAGLEVIARNDWQQIGAKGATFTLEAVAELIDTARRYVLWPSCSHER